MKQNVPSFLAKWAWALMGIDLKIPEIGPKIGQKFALDTNKHHHDVQRHLIIKSSYLLYTF